MDVPLRMFISFLSHTRIRKVTIRRRPWSRRARLK